MNGISASGAPAVSLRGVAKSYHGRAAALHPTDLDVEDGEFLCLLGPSGCGKTTLLNLIGGFLKPSAGVVLMDGARVDHLPPHRRNVNTVFQSYALFPHMSVGNNISFGLRMAKVPKAEIRERVREALRLVGLEGYEGRMPAALSGGQQQRVALARALVRRPRVLALDEPFGALDLNLRRRLQLELKQLHRELGITFLFVTHDQEEAMVMSDRIAVMSEGRIEQLATPSEVYLRPANRFVAEFVGESNFLDVHVSAEGSQAELRPCGTSLPGELSAPNLGPGRNLMMVRPEMVRLGNDPAGALAADVAQVSFLGDATRVDLRLPESGLPLIAKITGSNAHQPLESALTRRVYVSWDPTTAVVFPQGETHSQTGGIHVGSAR